MDTRLEDIKRKVSLAWPMLDPVDGDIAGPSPLGNLARHKSAMVWLRSVGLATVMAAAVALVSPTAHAGSLWQSPYPLVSESGETITLARWGGRPAIVTMEYSESSLICSVTLAYLKEVQQQLDVRGQSLDFIIISLDPKNDTPSAWSRYRKTFGLNRSNWHFLTASESDTPRLAELLNVKYRLFDGLIIHRLRVMRLDEQGIVRHVVRSHYDDLSAFFGPQH
jgi:protein SCO1/2